MNIDRNEFIEQFAKATPSLNLIFLNHSGNPGKLSADLSTLELLSDPNGNSAFITFCQTHPFVRQVVEYPQFRSSLFHVELNDGSQVYIMLIRSMIRRTLYCLKHEALRQEAFVNAHGMFVASHHHHFEYLILKYQFAVDTVPDRYRYHFAQFDFSQRAVIFKHMQARYSLVFNTLEDLYKPTGKFLLRMMVGLRNEKKNVLWRMLIRSAEKMFFNGLGFVLKRPVAYESVNKVNQYIPSPAHSGKSRQAIL